MSRLSTNHKTTSIRKRYFSQTLFLGLVIILSVLYFFNDTVTNKHKITEALTSTREKLDVIDSLEGELTNILRNIELFLLDPTIGGHDQVTHQSITASVQLSIKFNKLLINEPEQITSEIRNLETEFNKLKDIVSNLFQSRMDVNQQFPGLALSVATMLPPQQSVANNLQILIDEIENGDLNPNNKTLYPKLLKAYAIWMSEISQSRIYYTNRFASFSTDILVTQAESLKELHNKFFEYLEEFEDIYANEDSFEGSINIQAIKKDATEWFNQFQKVRMISESNKWRHDNYLMKEFIFPKFEHISNSLNIIKAHLHKQDLTIEKQLNQTTNTLFSLLAVIIILFLIFILTILFSLDRMIFQPISSVSQALKSKAFNHEAPKIRTGKSREIIDLVEAFQEMDLKISQRQNELEYQTLHDHLTGLPNRLLLNQRLEYQILTSERKKNCFSLFLMDLDKFKDVNDSLGHASGDLLLTKVAQRLSDKIRQVDTIARLGGDEFAILLPELRYIDTEQIANKITETITTPFVINDQMINIGISIGIVNYPDDGTDAKTLLQHADIAMYHAKKNRLHYAYFDSDLDINDQHRLTLINDLRQAIDNNSLELYYQTQINISNQHIFGAEALLRWQHPDLGFIPPDKIVELAEYSGFIHQLTLWVLDRAIAQAQSWHLKGYPINVSVNLSVHDLANNKLCEQIAALLDNHEFPPGSLTLEITESGMMENLSRSIEILSSLNEMGINLSIDDFGTGFSSLAYLKQLPVNELKIDKSFVLDMDKDENDLVIVQSIIHLGHNLGLKVVAEGVEEQVHLNLVNDFDCDIAQGYFYGKPKSAEEFLSYLQGE